jgi:hypothetical protein
MRCKALKEVRPMRLVTLALAPLALAACGNTYHPEYHPVTVTNYEQHVAYPAGEAAGARAAPVFQAPPPPRPPPPPPWSAWPGE